MIIRTVDVVDRRNTYVELTEKGRNLIDNAMKFIDEFYSRVVLKFGEEKLLKLQEMLTECRETAKTELTDMLENRKVSDS
jgi:DNA-binding MarR family transcriptional regulator